jgi:hypothetical protein
MVSRELLNALRIHAEMVYCECPAENLCIGCRAKSEQLTAFAPGFLYSLLGDLDQYPARLCDFYNFIHHTHVITHSMEEDD